MNNGSMIISQCKEIPDKPILEFLSKHKGQWCTWFDECERDVIGSVISIRTAMPINLASEKLVLAKMKRLINRGLVKGCACGCRGDFEITQKGEAFLTL
jgi:hypothetical protein